MVLSPSRLVRVWLELSPLSSITCELQWPWSGERGLSLVRSSTPNLILGFPSLFSQLGLPLIFGFSALNVDTSEVGVQLLLCLFLPVPFDL